ncbi:MAG: ammonium transporter [Alphaproteobacteria bacterium]|nr:ammonium transporter [Alphaproteobacteria bacterium]
MDTDIGGLTVIFTEFYYWVTVVMMFLIHVGFCVYEVGASRRKNLQHTLMKNTMLIPVISVTFFLFGWWLYWGTVNGPWINGGISVAPFATPWSELMGTHMGGAPVTPDLTAGDTALWARVNGVFWAAFLLFSWTTASIISGSIIERVKTQAFLIIATIVGSVTWIIDAAWGWSPAGWMVQLMGYHDAYASGVVHAIAGGSALAVLIVLGPRIGKFGPNGEVRDIPLHNPWLVTIGLFLIYTGFWGFYAACNIPIIDIDATEEAVFLSATNIYLMPTTLSAITFNFILSLSGGLMVGYMVSKANPFWTYSGGLAGVISASAGNDLYHPIQAFIVAAVCVFVAYKMHYWVERKFKIDDAVGAVAVHGYCGFFGVVIAGVLLWGYPAATPSGDPGVAWFGSTAEGFPAINPIGNFLGAIIMFWVLGFIPIYIVAKILSAFGMLRVPAEVEIAGLDVGKYTDPYPNFSAAEPEFERIQRSQQK